MVFAQRFIHGGLSQWGRSNRPRIRPGTVKSLNAPCELSQLALGRDYAKKIDPCRMLVWLGRRTVPQDWVNTRFYLAGRYKLGRSGSHSNLLRPRVTLIYINQLQRFSGFSLYPLLFFHYSPFKLLIFHALCLWALATSFKRPRQIDRINRQTAKH